MQIVRHSTTYFKIRNKNEERNVPYFSSLSLILTIFTISISLSLSPVLTFFSFFPFTLTFFSSFSLNLTSSNVYISVLLHPLGFDRKLKLREIIIYFQIQKNQKKIQITIKYCILFLCRQQVQEKRKVAVHSSSYEDPSDYSYSYP